MKEYHKIQSIYKRDPNTKFKTLLIGEFSIPAFDYLKNNIWLYTEKIDGTNIRIKLQGNKVSFGGKTENAQIPTTLIEVLQNYFSIDNMKNVFPDYDVCLYGEGYGKGIQSGGKYKPDGVDFTLFDVRVGDWWLKRLDVEDVACKLNIQCVPIVGKGTLFRGIEIARHGFDSTIGIAQAEGLVIRPKVDLFDRNGKRIITKIKYKDFIHLKKGWDYKYEQKEILES